MRFVALLVAALFAAAAPAAAEERMAPGGKVDLLGVSGAYACSVGDHAEIAFRIEAFEDGQYRIEERLSGGATRGTAKFPWQFATATLFRERVTARGATKFRRISGSLRTLLELTPNWSVAADYAEAPLDGASRPLEWRYEIAVGQPVAGFGPSGVGEVALYPITERRSRYVDAQGEPLSAAEASQGFLIQEEARVNYAPALGLPLRIERRRNGDTIESCALSAFRRS